MPEDTDCQMVRDVKLDKDNYIQTERGRANKQTNIGKSEKEEGIFLRNEVSNREKK